MADQDTNLDPNEFLRGNRPFERLVYALAMQDGTVVEKLEPDLALLHFRRATSWGVVLRWRSEFVDGPPPWLKPLLKELAAVAAGGVELVLVGGPSEAKRMLARAAPFFSTHRIYLYHLPDAGEPSRSRRRWPAGAGVWGVIEALRKDSLPAPDGERFREKLARDREIPAAERREFEVFVARGHTPRATYALLAVLGAVFWLELVLGGADNPFVLIRLGGLVPDLVRAGQWWRLLSCTVLHGSFMHFALNAYVLLALGSSVERLLGARRFLVLYWLSAIAGSASSAFLTSHTLSVGASGALWGLLGAEAALAFRPQALLPKVVVASARQTTVVNLGINLVNSFRPHVDMAAHLGGGVAGALLMLSGALTRGLPRLDEPDREAGLPPLEQPAWLTPGAGLLVVLAALSLGSAFVRGRAWIKDETKDDHARRAHVYEDGCAGGDVTSCFNLGLTFARGEGVAKDPARAAAYYKRACESGEPAGCNNLGRHYYEGEGVPKDPVQAANFYRQACDGGEARGCLNLGLLHYEGEGVPKDLARAAALYTQACNGGEVGACLNLGVLHYRGQGVTQDFVRAATLYKQACDGGDARGCGNLGALHYRGQGVAEDHARAAGFYKQACDGGEAAGCWNLGALYESGEGVARDPAKAAALYKQACEGGESNACDALKERR